MIDGLMMLVGPQNQIRKRIPDVRIPVPNVTDIHLIRYHVNDPILPCKVRFC